jgi:hypothetical protein
MEQYSTLDKLVDAFREKGTDLLSEINLGKKKLGKKLSSDIYSYIFSIE